MSAQDIVIVKGARNEPGSDFGKTCCCRATFARGIPAVQGGRFHGRHQQSSPRRGTRTTRYLLPKSAQQKTLASATASSLLLLLKSQKPMCGLFRKPLPMRPDLYWPTAGAARVR